MVQIGDLSEAYPGSFDDGLNLPAGWYADATVKTQTRMLSIGREWQGQDGWRFSAGLQGGTARQELTSLLRAVGPFALFDGELFSTTASRSNNRMIGLYGRVSGGLLTFELGYEGLCGVGNGVVTFPDPEGLRNTPKIDSDTIGAAHLSVGYAFRY
ncbi:MAG: hypothetical protein HC783_05240 [Rhodobacteraceae bacterium]|nr:hypothetical protein [Paracoccaceae bacterium]